MVVASYDRSFDHRKLQIAFDASWFHGRAMLATTSADRYCPLPGGRGEPDVTAIVRAIEGGVRRCEVRGQSRQGPDPIMLDTIMGGRGLETEDCVMSGEGLYTDVRMALDAGMPSAVVLTDDTKAGDLRNDP